MKNVLFYIQAEIQSRVLRSELLTPELAEGLQEAFVCAIAEASDVAPEAVSDLDGNRGRFSRLHSEDASKFVLAGHLEMRPTQTL